MIRAPFPTPTSTETASVPTAHQILPRTTPAPSSDQYPTTIVVKLETTLLIPDYPFYYDTPVADFNPMYHALPDGSLVTAPYRSDLVQANGVLVLLSILATISLRNIFVSGNYIRRIRVQQKKLFIFLFVSQLVGFVGLVPKSVSYVTSRFQSTCTSVVMVLDLSATFSIIIIMSGIIGYKAYKCLDSSVIVRVILLALTVGCCGVSITDCVTVRAAPRLSGSCTRIDDMRWLRIFVILQLAQSLFTCFCFSYAVWKSRHSPVARDRISIQLSVDIQENQPYRDRLNSTPSHKSNGPVSPVQQSAGGFMKNSQDAPPTGTHSCQESISTRFGTPLPSQSLGFRCHRVVRQDENSLRPLSTGPPASLAPSTFSRISHYMPELFRKVMEDELLYTATITALSTVVAVIAVVGVASKHQLSFMGWVCLYWGVTSILATHSLGRAVNRHEREALLHAAALHQRRWEPDRLRAATVNRPTNNWDLASSRRTRRITSGTNSDSLFSETQALTHEHSASVSSVPTDGPYSPRSFSSGSSLPLYPSPTYHLVTSGRTSPLVPLENARTVVPVNSTIDRHSGLTENELDWAGRLS